MLVDFPAETEVKTSIQSGDIVDVYFATVDAEHDVTVLYAPDSFSLNRTWKLQREDGTIIYVQNYDKMVLKLKDYTAKAMGLNDE